MALDPSISLAVKPPQLDNPLEIYQRALTLKQLGNAQLLQQQQLQEGQQRMQLGQQQLQENQETIQQKKLQTAQSQRTAKGLQLRDQAVADNTTPEGQIDHGKVISRLQAGGYPDLAAQYATEQKTAETADLQKQQEQAKLYATHADVIGQVAIGLKQIKDPAMRAGAMQGKLPDLVKNGILTPQQAQQLQSHSPTDEELDQFIEQSGKAKEYHENQASIAKEALDRANAEKATTETEKLKTEIGAMPQTLNEANSKIDAIFPPTDASLKATNARYRQMLSSGRFTASGAQKVIDQAAKEAESVSVAKNTVQPKIAVQVGAEAEKARLGMTDEDFVRAGQQYALTGKLPEGISSRSAAGRRVVHESNEYARDNGLSVSDMVRRQLDFQTGEKSLKDITEMRDKVVQAETTATKNLDVALNKATKIIDTGSPLFNKPLRDIQKTWQGKPELAAYEAARETASNEISKVLSGGTGGGAVSDHARAEADGLLRGDYSLSQLVAAANVLKQDMENRKGSLDDIITERKAKMTPDKAAGGSSKATHRFNPATGKIEAIK